jgi:hypothetical protein
LRADGEESVARVRRARVEEEVIPRVIITSSPAPELDVEASLL